MQAKGVFKDCIAFLADNLDVLCAEDVVLDLLDAELLTQLAKVSALLVILSR